MVHWHNNATNRLENIVQFCTAYLPVSVVLSVILIGVSYKSVIEIRLRSEFFSSDVTYSENVNNMLVNGFNQTLASRFFSLLPIFGLIALILFISYTVYSTFSGTHHSLKISNYINAKRESLSLIILRYTSISTAAFVVPLLYWCFLVAVWYPLLIKLPLRYITGDRLPQLVASGLGMIILVALLTHVGVILIRLGTKTFKHVVKG